MSTAPEMPVSFDSDVTTEIELEPVRDSTPPEHAAPVVRARRHAILLADVEASLTDTRPTRF
jgi:hypothetical protein